MQIINKTTNEIHTIDYTPTVQNLIAYYGSLYTDWLVVPPELEDKDIEVIEGEIVIKAVDINLLKQKALDFLNQKIEEKKNFKFEQEINTADGRTIKILTDILDSTLNSWVLLKNKSVKSLTLADGTTTNIRYVSITNSETKEEDYVPITDAEIDRLQSLLTNSMDDLQFLKINIARRINNTLDEDIVKIFNMSDSERQKFITDLIRSALMS